MQARHPSLPAYLLTLLLVWALLCAQWSGLKHSIAHAGWQGHAAGMAADQPDTKTDPDKRSHSCAAFDAACMADALHTAGPPSALLPQRLRLPAAFAFASWQALTDLPFFSHAPPRMA